MVNITKKANNKEKTAKKRKYTKPTEKPLTNRQKLFVDFLPVYNWDYVKSAVAAGYTQSYANARIHQIVKSNVGLCRLINDKRTEITAKTHDLRGEAERVLVEIMRDPKTRHAEKIKCIDGLGKMNGWQTTNINLESDRRQHELDDTKRKELYRLAMLRHNMLPAGEEIKNSPSSSQDGQTAGVEADWTQNIETEAITETSPDVMLAEDKIKTEAGADTVSADDSSSSAIDARSDAANRDNQPENQQIPAEADPMSPHERGVESYPSIDREFSGKKEGSDIGIEPEYFI